MTRTEHYLAGKAEGTLWAEADLRDGAPVHSIAQGIREDVSWMLKNARIDSAAHQLGLARGYRDTVARFDAGELTCEMFEMGPR